MADDENAVVPGLTWDHIREGFGRFAAAQEEWCGIPLPLEGMRLQIESRNPWREKLEAFDLPSPYDTPGPPDTADDAPVILVNEWWSRRLRAQVVIYRNGTGPHAFTEPDWVGRRWRFSFETLNVASCRAWSLKAELAAQARLATLIRPHLFEMYLLTGMLIETSPRSKLTYVFRRSRPTIVLTPHKDPTSMVLLTALCLHPIGYYEGTFSGSMVPTDDVIAHLLMMRADEPLYWRRANQHDPDRPQAGI